MDRRASAPGGVPNTVGPPVSPIEWTWPLAPPGVRLHHDPGRRGQARLNVVADIYGSRLAAFAGSERLDLGGTSAGRWNSAAAPEIGCGYTWPRRGFRECRVRCLLHPVAEHELSGVVVTSPTQHPPQHGLIGPFERYPRRLASVDASVAVDYGRIIAQCGWARRRDYNRMIAAHAISSHSIFVTNNLADFSDIPGLSMENWVV